VLYDKVQLEINKDDIVYITGDSGSGKSVLLRQCVFIVARSEHTSFYIET
jgi:ABC-type lipoprotein export system ATPase subunit